MHAHTLRFGAEHRIAPALDQLGTGRHFRHDQSRAEPCGQTAERRVGDA
jgi:hypothetical protein